ncbi:MAG TPA: tRNA uridine-5-carboxymethylaminomethyl(34) synthesis GTPase MnmE [Candidatus Caccalectryoclostridium excrementigallinarum]|uniref:tRNA modification GTPase MnmE n=1 Tax=Candidatus Caccalectryoclostridium excrementigallinarum TaxID=2840710 RepID=A0A9D1SJV1_9FIRM|nr:tRNA uridine-5-carboxymethylaminomethyl(34) synthesis GTPase MnmE [Candidatus Caccalectryoclostridium excrementigallinarum]
MDTIAAIATPLGTGAVGIIRLSGEDALEIAARVFSPYKLNSLKDAVPYMMYLGRLDCGGVKDRALAVFFRAPASYTGEDMVELHCHGGAALLGHVLNGLLSLGARIADRGEFTRRAFLNGKMDLSDAEGVIDMINGESAAAVNAGYRLATGGTSAAVRALTAPLLDVIAHMEAALDYPEEMEEESRLAAKPVIDALIEKTRALLLTCRRGSIVKNGITAAIVGETNVGKSSLLNALAGRERAIVTEIAGTTRDSIEESVEWRGVTLRFIDTAGIRESADPVESLGIRRSRNIASSSDIVLLVSDGSRPNNAKKSELLKNIDEKTPVIEVVNKSDIMPKKKSSGFSISAKTGENIDALKDKIVETVLGENIDASGELITSLRHKEALERALTSLISAKENFDAVPAECTLLDLRAAYSAFGEITGDTADEKIIDTIFAKFCLGK